MLEAKRTLVKSAPELWAEVSDPACLARHLAAFGPIHITRAERTCSLPGRASTAPAPRALQPSGFGTKVTWSPRPGRPRWRAGVGA